MMDPEYSRILDLFGIEAPLMPSHVSEELEAQLAPLTPKEQGDEWMRRGNFEKAVVCYRKALQENSTPEAHIGLGSALECLDRAPQAALQFMHARKLAEGAEGGIALGELLVREGRNARGIAAIEEAIEKEPENHNFRYSLAETLRKLGHIERSAIAIQQAIVCAPDQSYYHLFLGEVLMQMKRWDAALDALRAAIELSPGDDYLFALTSAAFWGAGKPQEAVKAVRLASDLDPSKIHYTGMLEIYLRQMGMGAEADLEKPRADKMDRFERDLMARILSRVGLANPE